MTEDFVKMNEVRVKIENEDLLTEVEKRHVNKLAFLANAYVESYPYGGEVIIKILTDEERNIQLLVRGKNKDLTFDKVGISSSSFNYGVKIIVEDMAKLFAPYVVNRILELGFSNNSSKSAELLNRCMYSGYNVRLFLHKVN